MSHVASLRAHVLALATCACAIAISPWSTQAAPAAATCAAAPKPTAPEGQHWRYHLDRTTNRKCWYLASEGGRKTRTVAMTAPTPREPQARTPAPPVSAEGIKHLTQPLADASAQAPAATPAAAVAQAPTPAQPSSAAPIDAAPVQAVTQAAPAAEAAAPANAPDQPQRADNDAQPDVQNTVLAVQPAPAQAPVEPVVAPKRSAASTEVDTMKMLPFALGALAAALLAAGAILFASGARRRRDTVVRIIDLNAKPRLPKAPRLADWSALSDETHGGDDDDRDGLPRTPQRRRAA